MKNRIGLLIIISTAILAFLSCDELGGADKPSNKTLAFFVFNDNTFDEMQKYDGTEPTSPSYVSGRGTETSPRAIDLNGTSQFIDVPGLTQSFDDDFSIAAWINLSALPGSGEIFPVASKGSGSAGNIEFTMYIDENGDLSLVLGDGATGFVVSTTGSLIGISAWHSVIATVQGDTVSLYVDPVSFTGPSGYIETNETETDIFTGSRITGNAALQIGRYHDGVTENLFDGIIDQVRIANYAYDDTTITYHY